VVDVGVGHQQTVDGVRRKGKLGVGHLIPALLQAAVHQNLFSVDLNAVAAAGHTLIGAKKTELHGTASSCSFDFSENRRLRAEKQPVLAFYGTSLPHSRPRDNRSVGNFFYFSFRDSHQTRRFLPANL
jgi:hypothetical protein